MKGIPKFSTVLKILIRNCLKTLHIPACGDKKVIRINGQFLSELLSTSRPQSTGEVGANYFLKSADFRIFGISVLRLDSFSTESIF